MNYIKEQQKKPPRTTKKIKPRQFVRAIKFLTFISFLSIFSSAIGYWGYGKFYINFDNIPIHVETLPIHSKVEGKVKFIHVEPEQYVTTGDLLVEFDHQEYSEQLIAAQAALVLAKEQLKLANFNKSRAIDLWETEEISRKDYNTAISNHETAQVQYDNSYMKLLKIQTALQHININAPANGWVIFTSPLNPGQEVKDRQILFNLIKDENFWLNIGLSNQQSTQIKPGQKVQIRINDFPTYVFEGIVTQTAKSAYVDPDSKKNIKSNLVKNVIKIIVENDEFHLPLREGMLAKISMKIIPDNLSVKI